MKPMCLKTWFHFQHQAEDPHIYIYLLHFEVFKSLSGISCILLSATSGLNASIQNFNNPRPGPPLGTMLGHQPKLLCHSWDGVYHQQNHGFPWNFVPTHGTMRTLIWLSCEHLWNKYTIRIWKPAGLSQIGPDNQGWLLLDVISKE